MYSDERSAQAVIFKNDSLIRYSITFRKRPRDDIFSQKAFNAEREKLFRFHLLAAENSVRKVAAKNHFSISFLPFAFCHCVTCAFRMRGNKIHSQSVNDRCVNRINQPIDRTMMRDDDFIN